MKMTKRRGLILRVFVLILICAGFIMADRGVYADTTDETDLSEEQGEEQGEEQTKTGWNEIDGNWYYYDSKGVPVTGWFTTGRYWYFTNEDGIMQTGWVQYGKFWYYLDANGRMATGWIKDGRSWYYLKENGRMATGWVQDGNDWYYLTSTGRMKTSWLEYRSHWYFFKANGIMKTGWLQNRGQWYYFRSSGMMRTGWEEIGGVWYFFSEEGSMATGVVTSKGKQYYLYPEGGYAKDGWLVKDGHTYHFDSDGVIDRDTTKPQPLVSMPGYYISPMYAGSLNTPEERIEAMIKRAYDYRDAGTTYAICKSQAPGQYADCSGLVMQCLYAAGFDPSPATPEHHAKPENEYDSRTIYKYVNIRHVKASEMKRGDLIFYNKPGTNVIIHIAIYLGDGKVIESWPPAVTAKYGVYSYPHTSVYAVARPFE